MNYVLVYIDKGKVKLVVPALNWCKENNYNMKKLATTLKLKNYYIVNKKDLPVTKNNWAIVSDLKTKRVKVIEN